MQGSIASILLDHLDFSLRINVSNYFDLRRI